MKQPASLAFSLRFMATILTLAAIVPHTGCQSASSGSGIRTAASTNRVLCGLDQLEGNGFADIAGAKVGLVTNHSGLTVDGRHILDVLVAAENVEVVAVFGPEHGVRGEADHHVDSGTDEATGLPIYSLYGETKRPTPEMLQGIDTLVFDIQDIGARFYTYIATMGICMEVAAENGFRVIVLDRPNPLGGTRVDGPIQDDDLVGRFTAYRPMPILHGMTVGELARMFNVGDAKTAGIGCDLTVIPITGWRRGTMYDETGLPWVNPSPNMRDVDEELLYTMVALTEFNKEISVGRGTDRPFEYLGSPWLDADALTADLRARNIPGLWVMRTTFIPSTIDITGRENVRYPGADEICQGVRFVVTNRNTFEPVVAGMHLLDALIRTQGERYDTSRLRVLVGAQWVVDALVAGEPVEGIVQRWRDEEQFASFVAARRRALLYR